MRKLLTTSAFLLLACLLLSPCFLLLSPSPAHAMTLDTASSRALSNGLIGWWTFDGPTMTTGAPKDMSGNGDPSLLDSFSPSTQLVPGVLGQAISLNGSTSFFLASTSIIGASNFTASMWVYPTSFAAEKGLFDTIPDGCGSCGSRLSAFVLVSTASTGKLRIYTNNGYQPTSSGALKLNQWNHIVFMRGGGTVNQAFYYINGVKDSVTVTLSPNINQLSQGNVVIGKYGDVADNSGSTSFFPGRIDDVRVYNRALSAAEVTALYDLGTASHMSASPKSTSGTGLASGLVGYWTFDGKDIIKGAPQDMSGNGETLKLVSIATSTFYVPGQVGQAVKFNGTTNAASTPTIDLTSTKIVTVAFWYRGPYNTDSVLLESSTNYNNNDGAILIDPSVGTGNGTCSNVGKISFSIQDSVGTVKYLNVCATPPANKAPWHHWVAVFDNSTTGGAITVYLDGAIQSLTTGVSSKDQSSTFGNYNWYMMARNTASVFTAGSLDDVRIYNRALSAQEVLELYNQGAAGKVAVSPKSTSGVGLAKGLAAYWTFDGKDMAKGVATDMSGNGNNGNLVNAATSTQYVTGKIGQALAFNGTNQYLKMADLNESTTNLSVFLWTKNTDTAHGNDFFAGHYQTTTNNRMWGMEFANTAWAGSPTGNELSVIMSDDGTINNTSIKAYWVSGISINDGYWHQVGFTWNNGTLLLYIDGIPRTATKQFDTSFSTLFNSNSSVSIGAANPDASPVSFLKGSIDDVRVYNRALSAQEVMELYNMGKK